MKIPLAEVLRVARFTAQLPAGIKTVPPFAAAKLRAPWTHAVSVTELPVAPVGQPYAFTLIKGYCVKLPMFEVTAPVLLGPREAPAPTNMAAAVLVPLVKALKAPELLHPGQLVAAIVPPAAADRLAPDGITRVEPEAAGCTLVGVL